MAANLKYDYGTPKGVAGGKADVSFDEVITRQNDSDDGVMKFGMGVVRGTVPGSGVKAPATGSVAANFEGVVLNSHTTEHDTNGKVVLKKGATVGVLKKGNVWARLDSGATPTYGEKANLIIDKSAGEVGAFTEKTGANIIDVGAKFGKNIDAANGIAVIVL